MVGDGQVITLEQSKLSIRRKGEENFTVTVERYVTVNTDSFGNVGEKKNEFKNYSKHSKGKEIKGRKSN